MTTRKFLVFIIFILSYTHLYSQIKVTGKVIDAVQKKPIDYCSIGLTDKQTKKMLNGTITNVKGKFEIIGVKAGFYSVKADFVGYKSVIRDSIKVGKSDVDLGEILLEPTSVNTKEVVVTGSKPIIENQVDKLVYNATQDVTSQGGVATDVLRKVPMVSVDVDGNVELQGSSNVLFLINGKPSTMFGSSVADALQAIPADQIQRIEVITSPGAKYDAGNTGGIINIILKDNKVEGWNGNVNLTAGTRLENGSLNLNYKHDNWGVGVFFSGNANLKSTAITNNTNTSYNDERDTLSRLTQQGNTPSSRNGYRSGINFNWSLTKKDDLSASFGWNHFGHNSEGDINQNQVSYVSTGDILSDYSTLRSSSNTLSVTSKEYSLNYKHSFEKEGHELNLSYHSSYGDDHNKSSQTTSHQTSNYVSGLRTDAPGKNNQTEVALDYTLPISKGFTFEAGAKATINNLSTSIATDTLVNGTDYVVNQNQTYDFSYKTSIYAGYLSSSFSIFDDFLDGKVGLRYEYTDIETNFKGQTVPSYGTYAPSFTIRHKFDESQSVKFAYTRRIQRPNYPDLNPYYNISDPHNMSTGNPLLKPEKGNNYELSYNKNFANGINIMVSSFYRYNTDDMQQVVTSYPSLEVDGTTYTDVRLTKRYNIGSQTSYGGSVFASLPITKKFNIRLNGQVRQQKNTYLSVNNYGFNYRVNMNLTYQFEHDFIAEAFGFYNSPFKSFQNSRPAFYIYSVAVRKQFMNKKLAIGLSATNFLDKYLEQKATAYGTNFDQTNIRKIPFRSVGISLTYRFGKMEFKKRDDDSTPEQPTL